jgi:hypothetical protein
MEKDRKVAHVSNNDVNRALAACGASPMPYRNFEELNRATDDATPTTQSTHEFPLLLEALPEIGQIPVTGATSEQPIAPIPEDSSPVWSAPERSGPLAAPRWVPTRGFESDVSTDKPNPVPVGELQTSRQTLNSVFRTLSAAGPTHRERIVAASGLQNIFSRL